MSPSLLALVLAPLALSSSAHAAQALEGDALRVYYDDVGAWFSETDQACAQALLGGSWIEFAWWGSPFQRFQLVWSEGGASHAAVASSYGVDDITLVSESDASTATELVAVHEYTQGSLSIVKTESWDVTGATMLIHFEVTNDGADDVTGLTTIFEFDPDQDQDEFGNEGGPTTGSTLTDPTYATLNDVQDPDGDGVSEWVQSVGEESGNATGFLACDPANSTLGHYEEWPWEDGERMTLVDHDGASGDESMVLQVTEPRTIAAGQTVVTSLLVAFAETEADALANAQALAGTCETCDTDADGVDNPVCGGEDCDDWDASAYPGAAEVWYDGADQDCSGGSDYDADGDGEDADAHGGGDCDDSDPSVSPAAEEVWYDGVDQDCSGGSDYDADGDGQDSDAHGGEDCDDTDPSVQSDCGGDDGSDDGGGDDGGGDGGDDGWGGTDSGGEDTAEDVDDDDDDDDKGGCSTTPGTGSLALGLLGGLALVGVRRRRA